MATQLLLAPKIKIRSLIAATAAASTLLIAEDAKPSKGLKLQLINPPDLPV
jgi:hypothetical protein